VVVVTFQQEIPEIVELVRMMEQHSERGCAIGLCFANGFPTWHHFSYAPEFLRRYEAEELAKTDLTLVRGFSSDGVFLWSEIGSQDASNQTMAVASTFGMNDGICFADTINGMKSIASISLTDTAQAEKVPVKEIFQKLQLAAIALSKTISDPMVSQKSIDYLNLVVSGRKDDEIAVELGLSLPGTRKRRKTALEQLGAKTLAQAVALATSAGLVKVYQNV
jgi:DNA-binding CsgD family transcriptional regulator